ncbi:MAG: hypothetical protein JWN04_4610 [Myxococcaceae bacterium]|nr:hypothetical protein [Myxococcaceae bacterium]
MRIMQTLRSSYRRSCLASLLLASAGAACSSSSSGGDIDSPQGIESAKSALSRVTTPSSTHVSALGADNRAFAFDMLHAIAADHPGENLLFSPYSISTALAMTYEGARGQTASEMQTTLHFELDKPALHEAFNATDLALSSRGQGQAGADGTPFRLNVDNSFWMQRDYPVLPAYLDVLAVNYGARVFLADFASDPEHARSAINQWVSDKTEKLIPELLPAGSIRADTPLVLTNTVYFNASWQTKFELDNTRAAPFTKLDGSQVSVSMMGMGRQLPYAEGAGWRAVALPYSSPGLQFVAVLPDAGHYQAVEDSLDAAWFDAMQAAAQARSVSVSLPKLDYQAHVSLKKELRSLGMSSAFGAADFSGMTTSPVAIDDVIHQAVIKVFEGGTIAAAATAVTIRDASIALFDENVTLDRPFLFAIFDQATGSLLFVGRVLDPTAM